MKLVLDDGRACVASAGLLALAALALLAASCSNEGKASSSSGGSASQGRPGSGESGKGSAPSVVFGPEFERIRTEAEKADKVYGGLMRIVDDPEASGGKCIEIPDKVGTPETGKLARAVYRVAVAKAGHYTFWCRRKWLDQCGDTFAVRFDAEGQPHQQAFLFGADDSSKPPRWGWSPVYENGKPRQFFFTAGAHVMEILNREDGPRLDLILLTTDRDYVPSDSEELPSGR